MSLLTPDLGLFVWNLVAFLILFFILKKFAWKPILNSLKEREKTIADSLASAEKMRAEMAQMKSDNEALLAKAREERAGILKEARDIKEKIISDAKEQAKAEASKVLAEAQVALQNQKMAALTDVKNSIGNMVIEVAEKVIRKQLDNKQEQEGYIRKLAEDLSEIYTN